MECMQSCHWCLWGGGVSVVPQSMSGFRGDQISYHPLSGAEIELDLIFGYRHLSPSAHALVLSAEEKRRVYRIRYVIFQRRVRGRRLTSVLALLIGDDKVGK